MKNGARTSPARKLDEIRAHTARELETLSDELKRLDGKAGYTVDVGEALLTLARQVDQRMNA